MNPTSLQENIVSMCSEVTRKFHFKMQQKFKQAGFDVTSEQFTVLTHLWFENGLTQQEISIRTGRDKTTISRILSNMIKKNLISKEDNPQDGRSNLIKVTTYGRNIQHQLISISGTLFHQSLSEIEPQLIYNSLEVLNKMMENLN